MTSCYTTDNVSKSIFLAGNIYNLFQISWKFLRGALDTELANSSIDFEYLSHFWNTLKRNVIFVKFSSLAFYSMLTESTMAVQTTHQRLLLRDWLITKLDNNAYRRSGWIDREEKIFCIPWMHQSRHDFDDEDSRIFEVCYTHWHITSGIARYREVSKPWDSGLVFSNRSETWQTYRLPRCLPNFRAIRSW